MIPSIANTTFSYALTLDKFRNDMEEKHRPSWVKITTITMVSKFLGEIDIQKLRNRLTELGPIFIKTSSLGKSAGLEWQLKTTKFYNQITLGYTDNYSTKSIKVFPNGSIQVAGCYGLFDCSRVIKQLIFLLKTVLILKREVPSTSFKVVMINTNFSLNYNINLVALFRHFSSEHIFNVTYDPDRYSAVKVKFKPASDMKQVTVSIFSTGKIIVTGAQTLKEIAYAYNIVNRHIISGSETIKVSPTEIVETFDIFMGYPITELTSHLKKIGYEPWLSNDTNYQINF
jgi:TATA-box binding protein (TBP) (component of TFIID and TFIIIB)